MPVGRTYRAIRRNRSASAGASVVLLLLALTGCRDATPAEPPPLSPQMHAVSPLAQDGTVGRIVSANPTVVVLDGGGQPMRGAPFGSAAARSSSPR